MKSNNEKTKNPLETILDIILGAIIVITMIIEKFLGLVLIAMSFSLFAQELMNYYVYDKPRNFYLLLIAIFILLTGSLIVVTQYLEKISKSIKEIENKYLVLLSIIPSGDNDDFNEIKQKENKTDQSKVDIEENKE